MTPTGIHLGRRAGNQQAILRNDGLHRLPSHLLTMLSIVRGLRSIAALTQAVMADLLDLSESVPPVEAAEAALLRAEASLS